MENKNTVIGIAIALIIIGALIVFVMQNNTEINNKEISFKTIQKGFNNDINERQTRVIRTAGEWSDLWTEMFPTEMIASAIDFDNKILIAAFQGEKPTGGYSIEIVKIEEKDNKIIVNVVENEPGSNCITTQAFTSPYHIVELDKTSKLVEFSYSKEVVEC